MTLEQISEDAPLIMRFCYMLDTLKFKEWLKTHEYLCEGPLAFTVKGVSVMIPAGADKWDKAGFAIDGHNGDKTFLPLLHQEAIFIVHRDIQYAKEWIVSLLESEPIAAQNSSNEDSNGAS